MTEIVQDDAWVRACRYYGFASPPDPVTLAPRQIEIIDGIAELIRGYEGSATDSAKDADVVERAIQAEAAKPAPREAIEQAREICEPLLYQRPCTGDDIENPGLLLWRRDYRRLCARIATALAAAEEKGRRKALDPIQMALGFGDGDSSHARHNLDVRSARVSSVAGVVVDAFYVTDADGKPIELNDRAAIEKELRAAWPT